jgi:hypothetical protein|tara:strand:+ start:199 stop:483 length:285 start_codon:yes stop_codon:yes gene_type:complete
MYFELRESFFMSKHNILDYCREEILGREVEANWGAMHPTVEGKILSINYPKQEVCIRWIGDDATKTWWKLKDIKPAAHRSVNGSPIGIHFVEEI